MSTLTAYLCAVGVVVGYAACVLLTVGLCLAAQRERPSKPRR